MRACLRFNEEGDCIYQCCFFLSNAAEYVTSGSCDYFEHRQPIERGQDVQKFCTLYGNPGAPTLAMYLVLEES